MDQIFDSNNKPQPFYIREADFSWNSLHVGREDDTLDGGNKLSEQLDGFPMSQDDDISYNSDWDDDEEDDDDNSFIDNEESHTNEHKNSMNSPLINETTKEKLRQAINSLGSATLYKVTENDKTIILPVHFPEHYEYRGEDFRYFNRQEYYCIVKKPEKKKTTSEPRNITTGRKSSKRISYGPGHKLEATHDQIINTKLPIPHYTSRVPKWPGNEPPDSAPDGIKQKWKIDADNCAKFILVTFRPEINSYDKFNRDPHLQYDAQALAVFLKNLRSSNSFIAKSRLKMIQNTINGMTTDNKAKILMARYRRRNRDMWSEFNARKQYKYDASSFIKLDDVDLEVAAECSEVLKSTEMANALKATTHSDKVKEALEASLPSIQGDEDTDLPIDNTDTHIPIEEKNVYPLYSNLKASKDEETQRQKQNEEEDLDDNMSECSRDSVQSQYSEYSESGWSVNADNIIESKNFTDGQRKIIDLFVEQYDSIHQNGRALNPCIKLITGDPGAGKSFCIKAQEDICECYVSIACVKATFMGIAAVNISGSTIQSFFHLGNVPAATSITLKELTPKQLIEIRDAFKIDTSDPSHIKIRGVLILDEISMIKPSLLGAVSKRLKEVTGIDLPFGGISTFLFGDFNQLDPVKASSLITGTIDRSFHNITSKRERYNKINRKNKKFVRKNCKKSTTKDNEKSINFATLPINSFYATGIDIFQKAEWHHINGQKRSKDEKHTKVIKSMTAQSKLTLSHLNQYKTLKPVDTDFEFAPILVSTNRERFDLTEIQAKRFAKKNKTHVIRWPIEVLQWKGAPKNNKKAQDEDPIFWQYFVYNAPAFCTSNLNVEKGIANGTSMYCHSITPFDEDQAYQIKEFCKSEAYGEVLSLDVTPKSANFEIVTDESNDSLTNASIDIGKVTKGPVVPFIFEKSQSELKWYTVRGGVKYKYNPSKVYLRSHFPFDLGFAMTIHKAQGRTMDKLTLVLSRHPIYICQLSWSAIYVALSRVEKQEDIRFLITNIKNPKDLSSIEYITRLERKKEVQLYFDGFDNSNGATWNPEKSYDESKS